jgi:hypothetical protein
MDENEKPLTDYDLNTLEMGLSTDVERRAAAEIRRLRAIVQKVREHGAATDTGTGGWMCMHCFECYESEQDAFVLDRCEHKPDCPWPAIVAAVQA